MNKKHMVTVCILALLLSSCAFLPAFTQEEYARRRHDEMDQQYAPYRERNTVEAYREFIRKYPDNMFVSTARYNLEQRLAVLKNFLRFSVANSIPLSLCYCTRGFVLD